MFTKNLGKQNLFLSLYSSTTKIELESIPYQLFLSLEIIFCGCCPIYSGEDQQALQTTSHFIFQGILVEYFYVFVIQRSR